MIVPAGWPSHFIFGSTLTLILPSGMSPTILPKMEEQTGHLIHFLSPIILRRQCLWQMWEQGRAQMSSSESCRSYFSMSLISNSHRQMVHFYSSILHLASLNSREEKNLMSRFLSKNCFPFLQLISDTSSSATSQNQSPYFSSNFPFSCTVMVPLGLRVAVNTSSCMVIMFGQVKQKNQLGLYFRPSKQIKRVRAGALRRPRAIGRAAGILNQIIQIVYFKFVDIQFMEPSPTNLVSATKLLLTENASDTHLFQNTYAQITQLSYNEEESLANKVGPLSQAQVYQLRSQILAYKHLVRNIPVPTALGIPVIHSNIWTNERQKLAQKAVTFYRDKIQKEVEIKNMITGNIKAPKDDPKDYEDQVRYMVDKRRNEIEKILEKNQLTDEARMKLQIQIQFLHPNVRNVYHRVLNRIVEGFQQDRKSLRLFESQLLDRDYYRREKLQRNRDAGNRVEKLQNQMKSDHEKRKKRKHKEMLEMMRTHKAQFDEFHKKKEKERKKIAVQARDLYEKRKKNQDQIENKQARKRLELLKQQNYTQYFNQLKKAKNSKINELFSQTNKFLKQLGAKVLIQKGNEQDERQDDFLNPNEAEDDIANAFENANSVYYNLTHTVKEEITKQPTILSGGELKNYQLQGLQWLVSLYNNKLNGILADEMGLGKTIQTISLLAYLIEFKKNYGPFLIVVPLSTISNWMAEFDKWAPSIKRVVYRGNPATRTEVLKSMKNSRWNVCITTYDFILKDRQKLNKYHWKYIVIDEGHKMKNAKSKFAGVLGTQYQSDHRLLLTGTPLQNNLGQLWALLNFLLPKVFSSCQDFQKWFSIALTKQTGGQNVQLTQQEQLLIINRLHQVLRPFLLRRIKKQVAAELPDKTEYVIKIELSAWQKMIYKRLSQRGAVLMGVNDSGKVNNTALNNLVMQLRKCCNHPYMFLKNYDDICFHDWIFRSSGKFELLDRILPKLKQFNHRVLIFTQMTHLMNIMQIYFQYKGVKHLRLDGATKERGQMTDKFNCQNSLYDVFLLSTRAGGLGLNLQSADTVIIFDSDWNPQMDLQAQDRAHRIGQKKQVKVLRFLSINTIEEDIYARATRKKNMDQILIQGGMYNLNSSQSERRQKIEDILKKTGNPEDKKDEIPDDEMINKILSRNEEEFDRFTKMDEERYRMQPEYYRNIKQEGEDDDVNPGTCRLMNQDQIPSWFKETANKAEQNKEYGRGNRVRKQVNYCDDLADEQFNNLFMDDNQDPDESNPLPKEKGRRGRKPQKQEGENQEANKQEKAEEEDNEEFNEDDQQMNVQL